MRGATKCPPDHSLTNRPTTDVVGRILTPAHPATVKVGTASVPVDPTGGFRASGYALVEGDNTITATATAANGIQTTASTHVTADFTPPALSILESGQPVADGARFAAQAVITLQASDARSAPVTTTLTADGTSVATLPLTLATAGGHSLIATARDLAGNQARFLRSVERLRRPGPHRRPGRPLRRRHRRKGQRDCRRRGRRLLRRVGRVAERRSEQRHHCLHRREWSADRYARHDRSPARHRRSVNHDRRSRRGVCRGDGVHRRQRHGRTGRRQRRRQRRRRDDHRQRHHGGASVQRAGRPARGRTQCPDRPRPQRRRAHRHRVAPRRLRQGRPHHQYQLASVGHDHGSRDDHDQRHLHEPRSGHADAHQRRQRQSVGAGPGHPLQRHDRQFRGRQRSARRRRPDHPRFRRRPPEPRRECHGAGHARHGNAEHHHRPAGRPRLLPGRQ